MNTLTTFSLSDIVLLDLTASMFVFMSLWITSYAFFRWFLGVAGCANIGWVVAVDCRRFSTYSKEMARKQQMAVIRDTWQAMGDPDAAPGQQKAGGPAKKSTLQCILTLCSYLSFYRELDTRQQYTPIRYCAIQREGMAIQYEQHSKLS